MGGMSSTFDKKRALVSEGGRARRLWHLVSDVVNESQRDQISLVAGGVAFFGMLALLPSLAAAFSFYGFIATPDTFALQLSRYAYLLPGEAREVLLEQLPRLLETSREDLGLGALVGLLFAIWSASNGALELMNAVQIAYDVRESRGFLKGRAIAIFVAISLIASGSVALILISGTPKVLEWLGLSFLASTVVGVARWAALTGLFFGGLSTLYHLALERNEDEHTPVYKGALVATLLWLCASFGFSFYVENFGAFGRTYGSLGGVVVLMLWLYVSSYVVVLGAELNARLSTHTDKWRRARARADERHRARSATEDQVRPSTTARS